jgi:hypothetical protein
LDIAGISSSIAVDAQKINESSVLKSLSQSISSNVNKIDISGQDKSYLLPEYFSSPVFVAQLSSDIFYIADKPYCGSFEVRCITLTYALTVLNPSSDYIINIENGFYYESGVSIPADRNLTIIGDSMKYTLLCIYLPQNGFFFIFFNF